MINKIVAIYTINKKSAVASISEYSTSEKRYLTTFEEYEKVAIENNVLFEWVSIEDILQKEYQNCFLINGIFVTALMKKKIYNKFNTNNNILYSTNITRDIARDKYNTALFLKDKNIAFPKTEKFKTANIHLYSYPLVLKERYGSKGIGVYLISSLKEMMNILNNEITDSKGVIKEEDYIIQDYIQDTNGMTVRVSYILDKLYVYGIKNDNSFLSNFNNGGYFFQPKNKEIYINQAKKNNRDIKRKKSRS